MVSRNPVHLHMVYIALDPHRWAQAKGEAMKPVLVFAGLVLCFYAGYLTACLMRAAKEEEDK